MLEVDTLFLTTCEVMVCPLQAFHSNLYSDGASTDISAGIVPSSAGIMGAIGPTAQSPIPRTTVLARN